MNSKCNTLNTDICHLWCDILMMLKEFRSILNGHNFIIFFFLSHFRCRILKRKTRWVKMPMEKEVSGDQPLSLVRSLHDQFLHSGTRTSSSGSRSSSATGYEAAAAAAAAQFAYQQHLSGGIMNQSVRSHRESSAFVPVQPSRSIPVSISCATPFQRCTALHRKS